MSDLPQPAVIVDAVAAQQFYDKLVAAATYERLLEALLVAETKVDHERCVNVGVRWMLENIDQFFAVVGGNIREFVQGAVKYCDLRRLMNSPAFLRAIVDLSDREFFFRMIYVRQGSSMPSWVSWALQGGLDKVFLNEVIVERLNWCAIHPVTQVRSEIGRFLSTAGQGGLRQVGQDVSDPAHYEFIESDCPWSILDEEHFVAALRACMLVVVDYVFDNWFAVRVRLRHDQQLLNQLFSEALGRLKKFSAEALYATAGLSVERRVAILNTIAPLSAIKPTHGWWNVSVPAFRLLLDVMFESPVPEGQRLFQDFWSLFTWVDSVLLCHEFRSFCDVRHINDDTEDQNVRELRAYVLAELDTRRIADGYSYGIVVVSTHRGRLRARVNTPQTCYVQDGCSQYTPVAGEGVVFKTREGTRAVSFFPYPL